MTFKVSPDSKSENKYILQASKQNQPKVSFKGLESVANFVCSQVQTGEIVGPTAVDVVAMIIPRTTIDFTRNKDAGRETLFRETVANITNCVIPGFVAAGIGWALGKFIKPELKINTALPVDSETLELLNNSWKNSNGHEFWKKGADKKQVVQNYFEHVLNKTKGLVGKDWIALSDNKEAVKSLAGELAEITLKEKKPSVKELKAISEKLVNVLGASENIRIVNGEKELCTTVNKLINGMHGVCREVHTRIEPDKLTPSIEKMTKIIKKKSVIAISIIAGLGIAQQAVNRYITKKRTGSDAFVGLSEESRKNSDSQDTDKNSKFKLYIAKALSVGTLAYIATASITNTVRPKEIFNALKGKNLLKKLEFNSLWPNLNQLRVVYAATLVGRMLAASDKHELRETNTRDIPGFLNWLVLGGFVSKGVGKWISKGALINTSKKKEGKGALASIKHFLVNEHLLSHAEIKAMFENGKINEVVKKSLNKKLNLSIFAGFAYSTLALGLFMPILNKHITNKLTAKKKNELQPSTPISQEQKPQDKPSSENITTLSFNSVNNEVFGDFIKTQQRFRTQEFF